MKIYFFSKKIGYLLTLLYLISLSDYTSTMYIYIYVHNLYYYILKGGYIKSNMLFNELHAGTYVSKNT